MQGPNLGIYNSVRRKEKKKKKKKKNSPLSSSNTPERGREKEMV